MCVLKEALRKYSLVPVVTRNTVEDDQLGDLQIPAGTKIFINMQVCWLIMTMMALISRTMMRKFV